MVENFNIEAIKKIATEHEYYFLTEDKRKHKVPVGFTTVMKIVYFADTFNDILKYSSEHAGEVMTKSQLQIIIDSYSDPAYTGMYSICIDDSLLIKPEKKEIDSINPNVADTITNLVEKGIITFDEGNFMYDHIRDQKRMEYTFEKENYTITIKLHEKRK